MTCDGSMVFYTLLYKLMFVDFSDYESCLKVDFPYTAFPAMTYIYTHNNPSSLVAAHNPDDFWGGGTFLTFRILFFYNKSCLK